MIAVLREREIGFADLTPEELEKQEKVREEYRAMPKIPKRKKKTWTLYILKLEHHRYYVGITTSLKHRMIEHKMGNGAWFTKKYKPLGIIYTEDTGESEVSPAALREDMITVLMMREVGQDRVKGGGFTQHNFTKKQIRRIRRKQEAGVAFPKLHKLKPLIATRQTNFDFGVPPIGQESRNY